METLLKEFDEKGVSVAKFNFAYIQQWAEDTKNKELLRGWIDNSIEVVIKRILEDSLYPPHGSKRMELMDIVNKIVALTK